MRVGLRLERSITIRSVTSGRGTKEESRNADNRIPTPPNAGSVAFTHRARRVGVNALTLQDDAQKKSNRNWCFACGAVPENSIIGCADSQYLGSFLSVERLAYCP